MKRFTAQQKLLVREAVENIADRADVDYPELAEEFDVLRDSFWYHLFEQHRDAFPPHVLEIFGPRATPNAVARRVSDMAWDYLSTKHYLQRKTPGACPKRLRRGGGVGRGGVERDTTATIDDLCRNHSDNDKDDNSGDDNDDDVVFVKATPPKRQPDVILVMQQEFDALQRYVKFRQSSRELAVKLLKLKSTVANGSTHPDMARFALNRVRALAKEVEHLAPLPVLFPLPLVVSVKEVPGSVGIWSRALCVARRHVAPVAALQQRADKLFSALLSVAASIDTGAMLRYAEAQREEAECVCARQTFYAEHGTQWRARALRDAPPKVGASLIARHEWLQDCEREARAALVAAQEAARVAKRALKERRELERRYHGVVALVQIQSESLGAVDGR
jgi:hypothetical protein